MVGSTHTSILPDCSFKSNLRPAEFSILTPWWEWLIRVHLRSVVFLTLRCHSHCGIGLCTVWMTPLSVSKIKVWIGRRNRSRIRKFCNLFISVPNGLDSWRKKHAARQPLTRASNISIYEDLNNRTLIIAQSGTLWQIRPDFIIIYLRDFLPCCCTKARKGRDWLPWR